MAVTRFEPFGDSGIDRLFERIVGGAGMSRSSSVPMDVYRRGNEYIVEMELPGVAEDDIDVRIERNALSVTAELKAEHRDGDDQIVCERAHAQVSRQLYLGEDVATDDVRATYDRGVLTLRIPIAEEKQPRRIQVGGAGRQQAIDVESTERSQTRRDGTEREGEERSSESA